jgi:D-aspartate ligase
LKTDIPTVVLKVVPEPLHHGSLGVVRTLGRLGVDVYSVHERDTVAAARSRYSSGTFVLDGQGAEPGRLIAFLEGIAAQIRDRALLITVDDVATLVVDEHAEELRDAFLFPVRPPGLSGRLANKRQMGELAREHGIPTPQTVMPSDPAEGERFLETAQFPVVLKGAESALPGTVVQSSLVVARTRAEALDVFRAMSPAEQRNIMIQEYIPGGPDSVWMFNGYFDEGSECLVGFTGRKLRQAPPHTGASSLAECVKNEQVAETTKRFMKELGYRGVLDIGYRYDNRDGSYKLLDVNPRVGATFRLFVDELTGVDVVRALYLDLTGQPVPAASQREGRRWVVEPWDARSSMQYRREGTLSPREWVRSLRGVKEAAWFARDDPRPFAAMTATLARNALRKARRRRNDGR